MLELDDKVYKEFSFSFDEVGGAEYALFSYLFETGSVGTRGVDVESISPAQPLDFNNLYKVSVQNSY